MTEITMTNFTQQVLQAVTSSLTTIISFMPRFFGALAVFVVGWIIARICKKITLQILKVLQFEPFAEKVGLNQDLERLGSQITSAELIGEMIKWTIAIVFLIPAVEVLGLEQIASLVGSLVGYIPNVVVAVIIVMVGTIIADLGADFVRSATGALAASTANFLAGLAKTSIVVFSILAALSQLKIATDMINTLFTGFVAMLAIAGGLAFGLGGKDLASDLLEDIRNNLSHKA